MSATDIGSHVKIDVTDNGRGVPKRDRARIFDPFFTTRMGRGTGLGLARVYTLVSVKMGGSVDVGDVVPHGARFTIRIPKTQERLNSVADSIPIGPESIRAPL